MTLQNQNISIDKMFIVEVNVHQGFKQEDSLVMNRASLEQCLGLNTQEL
jgi:hypothetical protein